MAGITHDAPLDIRFFKVNAGPVALIVDWISDRASGLRRYRASFHEGDRRRVIVETEPLETPQQNALSDQATSGRIGSISWELRIEVMPDRVAPHLFPITELKVLDMTLTSAPLAKFTGWITIDGRKHWCQSMPGMLSHYWGRRLPREWWWVSCNQFDVPGVALEATTLRSGLWGRDVSIGVPMGYLYLRLPDGKPRTLIAPPSIHWAGGNRQEFRVGFRRLFGQPIQLLCRGRDWNDWDDRIWNTLVGDLELRIGGQLIATAKGTAALERRFPPVVEAARKEARP